MFLYPEVFIYGTLFLFILVNPFNTFILYLFGISFVAFYLNSIEKRIYFNLLMIYIICASINIIRMFYNLYIAHNEYTKRISDIKSSYHLAYIFPIDSYYNV